jgi:hypothetical protein
MIGVLAKTNRVGNSCDSLNLSIECRRGACRFRIGDRMGHAYRRNRLGSCYKFTMNQFGISKLFLWGLSQGSESRGVDA